MHGLFWIRYMDCKWLGNHLSGQVSKRAAFQNQCITMSLYWGLSSSKTWESHSWPTRIKKVASRILNNDDSTLGTAACPIISPKSRSKNPKSRSPKVDRGWIRLNQAASYPAPIQPRSSPYWSSPNPASRLLSRVVNSWKSMCLHRSTVKERLDDAGRFLVVPLKILHDHPQVSAGLGRCFINQHDGN